MSFKYTKMFRRLMSLLLIRDKNCEAMFEFVTLLHRCQKQLVYYM